MQGLGLEGGRGRESWSGILVIPGSPVVNLAQNCTPQAPAVNAMTGGRNRRKGRPPSRLPDLPEPGTLLPEQDAELHNSLCRIMGAASEGGGSGDVGGGARELQKLLTAGIRQTGGGPAWWL